MDSTEKVNILLVDDQPENLITAEAVLGDLPVNLVKASSGSDALRHLLDKEFALILLDVSMPGMDGFETADFVRQRDKTRHTPIVFLTAIGVSENQMFRGYSAGAIDYLIKPVPAEILRAKVAAFVELYEKSKELERSQALLRGLNETLERRVAERTADLQRSEEQIRARLQEREVLLREIHHRVKNNLQIILSLIKLQGRDVRDPRFRKMLKATQERVKSMALLHEKLYQSEDLARADFSEYLQSLVGSLFRSFGLDSADFALALNADPIFLDIDTALPCGLIINELVSNSLKYAFPSGNGDQRAHGEKILRVDFHAGDGEQFLLAVSDNGVGLPSDMDLGNTHTLGLRLIRTLTEQLNGRLEVDRQEGTAFRITFPPGKRKKRR